MNRDIRQVEVLSNYELGLNIRESGRSQAGTTASGKRLRPDDDEEDGAEWKEKMNKIN